GTTGAKSLLSYADRDDKKNLSGAIHEKASSYRRGLFHLRTAMSYVLGLKCKECGHRAPVSPVHVCEQCFGPYEVEYDYGKMKGKVTRASIAAGPKSLCRYKDLLPVEVPASGFHSGFTPLKRAGRLAKELGCKELWIKDDSCNYPTY